MGNVGREMKILRKYQKEMLEIKNMVIENAFDELVSILDKAGARISKLEVISIETPKIERQREQR